jgi:hypothetical protein
VRAGSARAVGAAAPSSAAHRSQGVVDVPRAALDPGVHGAALGCSVLHGVDGEAQLLDQETQDAVAQLGELADLVGALAEGDHASATDEVAQRLLSECWSQLAARRRCGA